MSPSQGNFVLVLFLLIVVDVLRINENNTKTGGDTEW